MWFGNLTTFHYLCCCLEIDGLKLFWVAGGLKLIPDINRQGRGSPWRRNSIQSGTESTPLCSARVELPCLGITFSKVCVFSLSLLVRLCLGVQSKVSHKSAYPWTEASNILMSVGHILFFLMLLNLKQQDKKKVWVFATSVNLCSLTSHRVVSYPKILRLSHFLWGSSLVWNVKAYYFPLSGNNLSTATVGRWGHAFHLFLLQWAAL